MTAATPNPPRAGRGARALSSATLALALAAAVGCYTSPHPATLPSARGPRGVPGELRLAGQGERVAMELLEVRDTAYVGLRGGRVVIIAFQNVNGARFDGYGYVTRWRGEIPSPRQRERLRLLSRYPFGIPDAAMAELLRAAGQDAPESFALPTSARDSALARFLAEARAGTARYRSQEAAIADGYRRVGVDFPAMGEHWVSPARVLADSFAAARPAMLTYIRVDDAPRLAGVVYAVLLETGEGPPSFAPADGLWHEHNGSVVEESLPSHHHAEPFALGASTGSPREATLRVSVLHAWIWEGDENPDGVFVADNWALPFHRLGVAPSPGVARPALHALSLALDGEEYYALMLRTALSASASEEARIGRVLAASRERAGAIARAARELGRIDEASAARLAALWEETWAELGRVLPGREEALRGVREHL